MVYLHSLAMTVVMGGLLRDHNGHKTWVAWVFTRQMDRDPDETILRLWDD